MDNIKKLDIYKILCIVILAVTVLFVSPAMAAAASINISPEGTAEAGLPVTVNVQIEADEQIGTYYVELVYDTSRLAYSYGADGISADGNIILTGTGLSDQITYTLGFDTLTGGMAAVYVKTAEISQAEGDGTYELDSEKLAEISINGEDNGNSEFLENAKLQSAAASSGLPILGVAEDSDGNAYSIIDLGQYIPKEADWSYTKTAGKYKNTDVTYLTDKDGNVRYLYLSGSDNKPVLMAVSADESFYPVGVHKDAKGEQSLYSSIESCLKVPEEISKSEKAADYAVYTVNKDGTGQFSCFDEAGNFLKWDEALFEEDTQAESSVIEPQTGESEVVEQPSFFSKLPSWALYAVIAAIVIIIVIIIIAVRSKKRKRNKKAVRNIDMYHEDDADVQIVDIDTEVEKIIEEKKQNREREKRAKGPKPIISVQDVSMQYNVVTNNVSGIKDYMVQLAKHNINHKEFLALDHVSFDVYKGEVVGIIGTNGSGKSTLLKIVSGALRPTSGKVVVDKSKIQLLTLGTGFDMELTARENVYLNGAIIGYSKEFIDEHYNEIVEFAELQDFMEEQVKNFSSGMVSRLGFAIATVANAAEILILDEVLSVGDEFFRKKSLARVKEMIHGGSTVLIVSHSMGTIREHCDKVVWIEKGKLRMVGKPEEVCPAYQKMDGTQATK